MYRRLGDVPPHPLMPNKPKTPIRPVRIEDGLWAAAKHRAAERGETVSDVIRQALRDYIQR